MAVDYSQIELRIIAALAEDQNMIDAFKNGHDIHAATAAKVFHTTISEVTREQRSAAKAVNFGIIYGQSAFGLAQNLQISRTEAKQIIDAYFEQYPSIKSYMDKVIAQARELGYVETIMKRRRYLPDIHSANAVVRGYAYSREFDSDPQLLKVGVGSFEIDADTEQLVPSDQARQMLFGCQRGTRLAPLDAMCSPCPAGCSDSRSTAPSMVMLVLGGLR
jgi:hypothetical protein